MNQDELHIDSLAFGGAGVGRAANGKTVFVDGAAPGDTVRIQLTQDHANYAQAALVEVLQPGPARVEAPCPFAERCGGCQWQHIAYSEQLASKRSAVVSALTRIGGWAALDAEGLVASCQGSKRELSYRNKLELACGRDKQGRLVLGFHSKKDAPRALQGALRYLEGSKDLGIFRVGVRRSTRTRACEIALWTRPGSFPRAAAAKTLSSALQATSIVRVIAETGKARKVKNVEVLAGAGYWEEELGAYRYRVSAPSFFQVNTPQAEKLQRLVLEGLAIQEGETVADLYAGVGTFSLPLAFRAGSCAAVESAGPAVRDLRRNAEAAGVGIDVIGGDSARELPELGQLDALVVDPPRTGLAKGVAESIAAASPTRLAYVSCDPATLARDVARLEAFGYTLTSVTPVDLFPQTYHVETVSIFVRA